MCLRLLCAKLLAEEAYKLRVESETRQRESLAPQTTRERAGPHLDRVKGLPYQDGYHARQAPAQQVQRRLHPGAGAAALSVGELQKEQLFYAQDTTARVFEDGVMDNCWGGEKKTCLGGLHNII